MNLLNYFNTFDGLPDGVDTAQRHRRPAMDCRGADTQAEFDRQWPKTVAAILGARRRRHRHQRDRERRLRPGQRDRPPRRPAQRGDRRRAPTPSSTSTPSTGQVDAARHRRDQGRRPLQARGGHPGRHDRASSTASAFVNGGDAVPRNRPSSPRRSRQRRRRAVHRRRQPPQVQGQRLHGARRG